MSRFPFCLVVILCLSSNSLLRSQDCNRNATMEVGNESAAPGQLVTVELTGSSVCEVTGFSLAIGHEPSRVQFVGAEPGPFIASHAGRDLFFFVTEHSDYTTFFVAFDLSAPLTVPPASLPPGTVLATLRYRVLAGAPFGRTLLRNDHRKFGTPPISHIYSTTGSGIRPVLTSGSIHISPFRVDAGDDQMIPEGSLVTLAGSASGFSGTATYQWRQLSGPSAAALMGHSTPNLSVQLPMVNRDARMVFGLEVTDGTNTSQDTVEVVVIDVDSRHGGIRPEGNSSRRDFRSAASTVAFAGHLEWNTDLEAALWSEVRFRVTARGGASAADIVSRATLYADRNGDGDVDGGDRPIATVLEPFLADSSNLLVRMNEVVRQGAPLNFLLVIDRRTPVGPVERASLPAWPALFLVLLALALRGPRRSAAVRSVATSCLGLVLVALLVTLPACGGGAGGEDEAEESTQSLQFSIEQPTDVEINGVSTGLAGFVTGFPARGPRLDVADLE